MAESEGYCTSCPCSQSHMWWSDRTDSEGKFAAFVVVNTAFACGGFFAASIILTIAAFLSPANHFLLLLWIWSSFGVVAGAALFAIRVAYRKPVWRCLGAQTRIILWVVRLFILYAAIYLGLWQIIHPSGVFSFELHRKPVLFTAGGLLGMTMIVEMSHLGRSVEERLRLFEVELPLRCKVNYETNCPENWSHN